MANILIDTNIVIHRETAFVRNEGIGPLFGWLHRLNHNVQVHPVTIEEIGNYHDQRVVNSFNAKINSYHLFETAANLHNDVRLVCEPLDQNTNSRNDTILLNEVFIQRSNYLITEDKGIHKKAALLGLK